MNRDPKWHRLLSLTGLLSFMLGTAGCVLPGGLTPVGGQQVNGWIRNPAGKGIPDQKLVLVQGHFDRLDTETVQYVTAPADVWKVERVELITNADGCFTHKLRGFTHCHPTWIIPPLGALPSKINGEADHGKFFILQTPGSKGGIYEIRQKGSKAIVRKWCNARNRRQRVDPKIDPEVFTTTVHRIKLDQADGYYPLIPGVTLEIVRRH